MNNKPEKGKRSKKFLHALHIFWEFLRKIWTTMGESPKGEVAEHASHKAVSESASKYPGKTNGITKGVKTTGKKTLVKSTGLKGGAGLGSLGIGAKLNSLLSSSSAASVGSSSTTISTILSAKTFTILLVSSGVFLGGLGTYSYMNQENPINVLENLITPDNPANNPNQNILNPNNPNNLNLLTKSIVPAIGTGTVPHDSASGSGTTGNSREDDDGVPGGNEEPEDTGTENPHINYTIP